MGTPHEDHERIDLIDVDRAVFVDHTAVDYKARHRSGGSRQVLKGVGVVALIAVAAVTWWPSSEAPEWRVYKPAPVPAAGLTDELIFDRQPGPLAAADLAAPPVDLKPEIGYVFGEPGGTITTRRWASFRTRSTNLPTAPASAGLASVNGVPADIRRVRVRHDLTWGPVEGRTWSATTNLLNEDEALEFANHVALVDGSPAIAHRFDLRGMKPVGSIAALDCVILLTDLLRGERGRGAEQPTLLTWATLDGTISLGSIVAPSDALPLVEFVLGEGRPIVVHNQPAVFIAARAAGNPVIAWIEDGRLIVVTGDATDQRLHDLAESVRPADNREWRIVARTSLREDGSFNLFGDGIRLYRGDDGATGDEFDVTANIFAPGQENSQLVVCVNTIDGETAGLLQWCNFSPPIPPLLFVTEPVNGRRFVVAFIDAEEGEGAELRIKLADGTWTLALEDLGAELPGWAVAALLPHDFGPIQLWSGGEVVAAI